VRYLIIALLTFSLSVLAELKPQLAQKGQLLLAADFSQEPSDKWKFLHGTRFKVEEGRLVGVPSTKEYQAAHKGSHSGGTPSSRLYVISQDVIMQFSFQMKDGLREVHIGANDGTFKTGSGHVGRVSFSTRSGLSLIKDRNIRLEGDKTETLANKPFEFKNDQWYTVMVEFVGDTLSAQVEGGPSLSAKNIRFKSTKSDINLPTRGGGKVLYDNVFVWQAQSK
jgi:hypothetical protein